MSHHSDLKTEITCKLTHDPQDPRCEILMTAEHIPADEENGLAAVGENIVYDVRSTNVGNVDVSKVTMVDSVGACRATMVFHKFQRKRTQLLH